MSRSVQSGPRRLANGWTCFIFLAAAGMAAPVSAWQTPPSTPRPQGQDQMQVMAVVNGQQITREQLAQEAMRRFGESVAESIVNKHLVADECRKQGIVVTEADVDEELDRLGRRFRMTAEEYVKLICTERNLTPHKLRNEVVWNDLALRRLAASMTEVSDEEIRQRLDTEYGPKVQVRAIAVTTADKAQKILAAVRANPEQFSRMAINHSVDQNSASVGGLLGPLSRDMGEPELEQVAFGLQVGQISDILQIQDQFLILKCERHYPATQLGEQDLLLASQRIREEIRKMKLGAAVEELSQRLQDSAEIVNVINNEQLRTQMPGVVTTVNGRQVTMDEIRETCLTRFGRDVLQSEINRVLISQRLQQAGESVTDQDLEKEITRAAREYGVTREDGSGDLEKWIAYVTRNDAEKIEIYVQDEVWPTVAMKKIVSRTTEVTDEDMQRGFESNYGPRVEVLAIVLSEQRVAQRVWEMAKSNQTEKYFGELAHQYSAEPASRAHYGEVPPIRRHGGQKIMEEEAFRLKPGEISGLIPLGKTWIILWCKGRTNPVVQDFDVVKDELYRDIMEKKLRIAMAEEFEQMRTSAQVDNFLVGSSQPGARAIQAARQGNQVPANRGR